jgi:hypothetical protein
MSLFPGAFCDTALFTRQIVAFFSGTYFMLGIAAYMSTLTGGQSSERI